MADCEMANHISGSLDRGRVEPSAKQRRFKAPPMCGLTLHKLLDDDLTSRQAKSHETDYFSQGCISCGILVSGIRARGANGEHGDVFLFSNLGAL